MAPRPNIHEWSFDPPHGGGDRRGGAVARRVRRRQLRRPAAHAAAGRRPQVRRRGLHCVPAPVGSRPSPCGPGGRLCPPPRRPAAGAGNPRCPRMVELPPVPLLPRLRSSSGRLPLLPGLQVFRRAGVHPPLRLHDRRRRGVGLARSGAAALHPQSRDLRPRKRGEHPPGSHSLHPALLARALADLQARRGLVSRANARSDMAGNPRRSRIQSEPGLGGPRKGARERGARHGTESLPPLAARSRAAHRHVGVGVEGLWLARDERRPGLLGNEPSRRLPVDRRRLPSPGLAGGDGHRDLLPANEADDDRRLLLDRRSAAARVSGDGDLRGRSHRRLCDLARAEVPPLTRTPKVRRSAARRRRRS